MRRVNATATVLLAARGGALTVPIWVKSVALIAAVINSTEIISWEHLDGTRVIGWYANDVLPRASTWCAVLPVTLWCIWLAYKDVACALTILVAVGPVALR